MTRSSKADLPVSARVSRASAVMSSTILRRSAAKSWAPADGAHRKVDSNDAEMTLAQSHRRGGVGRGASIYSVGRRSDESKAPSPANTSTAPVLSAPGFDLQSLPGDRALEDAGLRVNEVQRLSVAPCVVRRSLEMGRARDR